MWRSDEDTPIEEEVQDSKVPEDKEKPEEVKDSEVDGQVIEEFDGVNTIQEYEKLTKKEKEKYGI